jgi:hypothetical protein
VSPQRSDPDYMRRYRDRNPEYVAATNQRRKARSAALKRLADAHESEFNALLKEEMRKAQGLPAT